MTAQLHSDIVVGQTPGFRSLAADLYLGRAPEAVCVYLHGGGWRRGTRRDGPGHMNGPGREHLFRMAERGLAVVASDYRLSGEATFPAQLDDVVAACDFVRDGLDEFGLAGLPLTLWGASAGAQLAALAALASPVADRVAAVACWSAPSDLVGLQADLEAIGGEVDHGPGSREALLLGGVVTQVPELAAAASPARRTAAVPASFQLVHGTADVHVPFAQSERFVAALHDASTEATLVAVEGADHFYTTIDRAALADVVDESADFLLAAATTPSSA